MARIEIFDQQEEEKEVVVRLKLAKTYGGIELIAVDEYGEVLGMGHILRVGNNGMLYKYTGVNVPGLQTYEGAIKEDD